MKYRILILIIIIISLGEILLSYIANTSRTHAHTHTHTPPSPFRFDASVTPKHDKVNAPFSPVPLAFMAGSWVIQINTHAGDPIFPRFFAYIINKLLGRTETRTRDRMYCHTIRIVRDISRDDRARIATCSLRTPTDRFKENHSIDIRSKSFLLPDQLC